MNKIARIINNLNRLLSIVEYAFPNIVRVVIAKKAGVVYVVRREGNN